MKKHPKDAAVDAPLSEPQERALRTALNNHGIVIVARGFGLDRNVAHAINGKIYRQLVWAKLLTPRQDRQPFTGEAISTAAGQPGYLTAEGEKAARALVIANAEKKLQELKPSGVFDPKSASAEAFCDLARVHAEGVFGKSMAEAMAPAMRVKANRLKVVVRLHGKEPNLVAVWLDDVPVAGEVRAHVQRLVASLGQSMGAPLVFVDELPAAGG